MDNPHPAPAIYIQLKNRVTVPKGKDVMLRDVAFLITEPEWREPLYSLLLLQPEQSDGNLILIDLLTVIPRIHELLPHAEIQPIGEGRTIVQIEGPATANKPSIALFVLVWLLLFFGSALTIMNFHADVSMQEVQIRIVEMLTGRRDEHPYVFQIAYSLGIGLGMVIFSTICSKRNGTRSRHRSKWRCSCIRKISTTMSSTRNIAK